MHYVRESVGRVTLDLTVPTSSLDNTTFPHPSNVEADFGLMYELQGRGGGGGGGGG